MKTVSPGLFSIPSWGWLLVLLFCLLLIRFLYRDNKMRASGLGLVAISLVIFGAVTLIPWQHIL